MEQVDINKDRFAIRGGELQTLWVKEVIGKRVSFSVDYVLAEHFEGEGNYHGYQIYLDLENRYK